MKLLIISNMAHYRSRDGRIVGWGPAAQEIDSLAGLFSTVRHIGCLHDEEAPASALPYRAANVTLVPLAPAGGNTFFEKLKIAALLPRYIKVILEELKKADAVHVRCPANIPLAALVVLMLVKKPVRRWVKYAGNWVPPEGQDPWSYALQRWMLKKNLHRGFVTVNGEWPDQPSHVKSFFNPCLTSQEVQKLRNEEKTLQKPVRLLFVGALEKYKGVDKVLKTARFLEDAGTDYRLAIVGDGAHRTELERLTTQLNLTSRVQFHGWKPKHDIAAYYRTAHLMVLASETEGWPKVLSEAMAHGVVPVASDVSCVKDYFERFQTGRVCNPEQPEKFAETILGYVNDPQRWQNESLAARRAAGVFTYENYLEAVKGLINA